MRRILVLIMALAVMLALAVPAGATQPSGVNFEVEMSLLGDPSPFVASGPAVDSGLMCSEGEVLQVFGKTTGFQSAKGYVNFQAVHQFTCDDGSGDFLVKLQVRFNQNGDNFQWNILSGAGDYEDLHGTGDGIGLPDCGLNCVFDIYTGGLHIE